MEHDPEHLRALISELEDVRRRALEAEREHVESVNAAHPSYRASARNLLHYLVLRSYDLRELQDALEPLGVASLGRVEANTLASLNAIIHALECMLGQPSSAPVPVPLGFREARRTVEAHADVLFGPACPRPSRTRIMVTLPLEAADDPQLLSSLLAAGMDVARINCAYGDLEDWRRMAANARRAARELDRPCQLQFDLAGPKLRTGSLQPGPRVIRVRPTRDQRGRVTHPARVWLAPADQPPPAGEVTNAWVPVRAQWAVMLREGTRVRFRDARGRRRYLEVVEIVDGGAWAECDRTCYVETGIRLRARGETAHVGALPAREQVLVLRRGDRLMLTASSRPGRPSTRSPLGFVRPATIPCTLPEVLERVRVGEEVKFDDGKIEAVVRAPLDAEGQVELEITHTRAGGGRLRANKGINLPDTDLQLTGLTEKDRRDLDAAVELADVIGLSFVNCASDVHELQRELDARGVSNLGVIFKIETQKAIEELPWLLLAAMRLRGAGVMIARGDLAVECGWERLAELQEELLWFCEAAHMPVVWATQVLESMTKEGTPSRAEITDAAMANRAECVMLNKGPHILDAIGTLDDILGRMSTHQRKSRPRLRRLGISSLSD